MNRFNKTLLVMFFSAGSCGISDPPTDLFLDPIDSKVNISVYYDDDPAFSSKPGYVLLMWTDKIYPCFNYEIKSNASQYFNMVDVQLYGITIGPICLTALGPASAGHRLRLSSNEYILKVQYKSDVDIFKFAISNQNVTVTQIDTSFTRYVEMIWK